MKWDKGQTEVVEKVLAILTCKSLSYFLLGATARNLLFASKGLDGLRKTNDWDFAVCVKSWNEFNSLIDSLVNSGFRKTKSLHTLTFGRVTVDIVPFGDVELVPGKIEFPEPSGTKMNVAGFAEFLEMCEEIEINDIPIKVGSLPALLGTKILAYDDRRAIDDAKDIDCLIRSYKDIEGTENFYDQVASIEIEGNEPFDEEIANFYLSGRAFGRSLTEKSRETCIQIIKGWAEEQYPEILRHWVRPGEGDEGPAGRRFQSFMNGLTILK